MRVARQAAGFQAQQVRGIDVARAARGDRQRVAQRCERAPGDPHSMTGMITQRIAADAPSRVTSAIVVCPVSAAGNQLSPDAPAFFASTIEDDDALRRLFSFVTGGLSDGWAERKMRQSRDTVSSACRRGYLEMLVTANFVDDVRSLETPYLVIVGDKDPGLDSEAMQHTFLAWCENAKRCDFRVSLFTLPEVLPSDFRRDNVAGIRNVCRQFVILCRDLKLFSRALVAIDGSKFKRRASIQTRHARDGAHPPRRPAHPTLTAPQPPTSPAQNPPSATPPPPTPAHPNTLPRR
ncbi:alpha/beta fold hydrolase [Burkholderia ubonensis]|uniref:alpha/beta fold hydrolase n=1 Tax=Burkholderia ubonensis TaxID=101571 RepID=UPI001E5F4551|nr:alpha/beta hydrolase [Burkholderia ubonensis]